MLKYVLFDLDGTLLPMDQDVFVKAYFRELCSHICPFGYSPDDLVKAVWNSTKLMYMNDGSRTNESVFWKSFSESLGDGVISHRKEFDDFYRTDFNKVKSVCSPTQKAPETLRMIKEAGLKAAVATLPVFPAEAIEARIRWAGIDPGEFEFYTSYETCRFTKPSVAYYEELLRKLGCRGDECLMVGNNVDEDMTAEKTGMKVFLLTDCLINEHGRDIEAYPHGSFDELQEYIKKLTA